MNRPRPGVKARPGVEQEGLIVARVAGRVKGMIFTLDMRFISEIMDHGGCREAA